MSPKKVSISSDFSEAKERRFEKYYRFDNSVYWNDYYSKKLKNLDISREKLYASIIHRYIGDGAKVVDVGSGLGFLVRELARHDIKVIAVDLFEDMLKEAKQYAGKSVEYVKSDILELPFKKRSLDCIVVMSVLEHFPFQEVVDDILPYLKSFLKPGGYLFVHVPIKTSHSKFSRFIRKYIQKDLPDWAIDDDGDITHKMWLSFSGYTKMIERAGFELVNFDFRLHRSNIKPRLLHLLMNFVEKLFSQSDQELIRSYSNEPVIIRLVKLTKLRLALTTYMLYKEKE